MRIKSYLPHLTIFLLTYTIREYKIEKGNFVIWDEAHFGKFSQKYLNKTFYFDVHPPCGKMLTALSGYIFGQSDAFKFTSREKFPDTFDYVGMRRMHAFISSFVPFFAYLILRKFKISICRSMLYSMLLIFDNGLTSIGRLILLDSHLLAFTAATAYALVCLATDNQGVPQNKLTVKEEGNKESKKNPHEIINDTAIISSVQKLPKHKLKRYKSINTYPEINKLTAGILGVLLGCVISIKWIGCLVMLLAGIFIIYDLYMKLLYCKMTRVIQDFTWYALFLILVPLSIYVGLFYIHFKIVNESGEDDGFMSTRFQFSLKNGSFTKTRKYISLGKQVTIKSNRGYLHSHTHVYGDDDATDEMVNEEGALRQTTIYSAKDSNNNFYFQNVTDNKNVTFLKNLDNVVIYHAETKGYIEPNSKEAYYSKGRRIVNRKGVPMRKSVWIVESANDSMGLESKVKAISTEVYLKNLEYNCYLNTSENKYPGWGYNQGEVFCAVEKEDATMWHVEENFWSEKDGNPLYTSLRSSFISNLIEHNILMFKTNKGFVQNEDLEPERIISKPGDWPILKRGLKMSQWGDKHKFYMFMNPMLLYLSTFGIMALPLYYFYSIIKNIRQLNKQTYRNGIINKQKHRNDKIDKHSSFKIAEMTSNGSEGVTFETANFKRPVNKSREIFIEKDRKRMKNEGIFVFMAFFGWAVHYIAFFCVGRVLYLHHYFPAYFFSMFSLFYFLQKFSIKFVLCFVACSVIVYFCYSPLTYGFTSMDDVKHLKLLPSWDFTE